MPDDFPQPPHISRHRQGLGLCVLLLCFIFAAGIGALAIHTITTLFRGLF